MSFKRRSFLVAAVALTILVAACFVARKCYGVDLTTENVGRLREWFTALTNKHPVASSALFFAFVFAASAAGLSRLALCALAGAIFGKMEGAALALPATVLGSWVVYMFGRLAGIERVKNLLGARARHITELPGEIGWLDVVVARQIPLPAPIINLLLAAAATRTAPFFAGTIVGYLPTTLIAVFLGHGAVSAADGDSSGVYAALAASIFTALVALGLRIYLKSNSMGKTKRN